MTGDHERSADQYRLSEAENARIFTDRLVPREFGDLAPAAAPVAHFFGAQPGAGKSVLQRPLVAELAARAGPRSVMRIIGDEFRPYHPLYGHLLEKSDDTAAFYTDRDAGRWVERAIEHSVEHRPHVVLEGTLRDPRVTLSSAEQYQLAEFGTELHVVAVSEFISRTRIFGRYLSQVAAGGHGRYTLPEAHHRAYQMLPASLVTLHTSGAFFRTTLYDAAGTPLISASPSDDTDGHLLAAALARERDPVALDIDAILTQLQTYEHQAYDLGRPTIAADIQQCMRDLAAAAYNSGA